MTRISIPDQNPEKSGKIINRIDTGYHDPDVISSPPS